MPLVQISIMQGRKPEQIETMIQEVTNAIVRSLDAPAESVRVLVTEMPKTHWGIGGKSAKALGR